MQSTVYIICEERTYRRSPPIQAFDTLKAAIVVARQLKRDMLPKVSGPVRYVIYEVSYASTGQYPNGWPRHAEIVWPLKRDKTI